MHKDNPSYDKLMKFYRDNPDLDQDVFFSKLAKEFQCSDFCAVLLWYAEQRSWFVPEMIDELVRLDKIDKLPTKLFSGEFMWCKTTNAFIEEQSLGSPS